MGLFTMIFGSQEDKMINFALNEIEAAIATAAKMGNIKRVSKDSIFITYSYSNADLIEKTYTENINNCIKYIKSPNFTKFSDENKKILIKALEANNKCSAGSIVNYSKKWTPPTGINPRFKSEYGKEVFKENLKYIIKRRN